MIKILVFILFLFSLSSCYFNISLIDDAAEVNEYRYMKYCDNRLFDHDSCNVTILLENLDGNCEEKYRYVSKNEKVKIYNSEIKINISNLTGNYKRFMHIYIYPEIIFEVNDTITL